MHACVNVCVWYMYVHVCIRIRMCACTCIVHVYACKCLCISGVKFLIFIFEIKCSPYIHTYIHTYITYILYMKLRYYPFICIYTDIIIIYEHIYYIHTYIHALLHIIYIIHNVCEVTTYMQPIL